MQGVFEAALLLAQIVQLGRLLVRGRRGHEISLLLVFQLRVQLEDFLVLLVLSLIILRKIPLLVINGVANKATLIL